MDGGRKVSGVGVTGASGLVGAWLVRDLVARGFSVREISRTKPASQPAGVGWAASPDLGPEADWSRAVAGLDVIIHAAARVHVMNDRASDPLAAFRAANTLGTLALARQAAAAGVKRLVFVSSIKVNGEGTDIDRPYRADDPAAPCDPYGQSKLEAEQGLFDIARATGLEVVVVRPVLVYGPRVKANFRAVMKAVASRVPLPFARVRNLRSMVFVGNLSDLCIRAAEHPAAVGETFLVSDGEDLSTADLVRRLALAMGRRPMLVPIPIGVLTVLGAVTGKGAAVRRLLGSLRVDITHTRSTLDWRPAYTVEQGFAETVAAFRADRESGD